MVWKLLKWSLRNLKVPFPTGHFLASSSAILCYWWSHCFILVCRLSPWPRWAPQSRVVIYCLKAERQLHTSFQYALPEFNYSGLCATWSLASDKPPINFLSLNWSVVWAWIIFGLCVSAATGRTPCSKQRSSARRKVMTRGGRWVSVTCLSSIGRCCESLVDHQSHYSFRRWKKEKEKGIG